MTQPERDEASRNGIRKKGDLALDDGVKKVRVVVYDHCSNEVGSLTPTGIGKAGRVTAGQGIRGPTRASLRQAGALARLGS